MSQAGEHLKALKAAGKAADAHAMLREHAAKSEQEYAAVRADASLSDAGKQHRLAGMYRQRRSQIDRELERMAKQVTSVDRDDAGRVFGIKGLPGDVASLAISRRDAVDRVTRVESVTELRSLLRSATRSGDEVLARAVAERALENLDDTTLNQFLDDRPDLDASVNRLWNAQRAEADGLNDAMLLADVKPHEMTWTSEDDIERIAETDPVEPAPQGAGQPFAYGGDPL